MRKISRAAAKCLLVAFFSLESAGNGAVAQNVRDFINMFGGVLQPSIATQAADEEWRKLPRTERSCLDQALAKEGESSHSLIQRGIMPSDPRLSYYRSVCRAQVAQPPLQPVQIGPPTVPYVVGGITLGARLSLDSAVYKSYACNPSDQFAGFIWCKRSNIERGPKGEVTFTNSILHSSDGSALYINRYVGPAFFDHNTIDKEIERLSRRFAESPRVLVMPQRQGLPSAVIAIWGQVRLVPLDNQSLSILASGGSVRKGFLIDFLGNFERSVRQGLAVYRLSGGAGYVWSASRDESGRGHVRFAAVDASSLPDPDLTTPPVPEPPKPPLPDPWKDCQSKDTDTRFNGCTLVINANGFGSSARLADALDGRCWAYISKKEYEHAIVDCKKAIDLKPRFSYAWNHLGEIYLRLGDHTNAINALTKAIELKTNFVWSRVNRAEALETSGQISLATKDYQYALFINPSNQTARDAIVKLAREKAAASETAFACLIGANITTQRIATKTTSDPIEALRNTIASLDSEAKRLTELAQLKLIQSNKHRHEAEGQRGELLANRPTAQELLNEVQKASTAYFDSRTHLDETTSKIRQATDKRGAQSQKGHKVDREASKTLKAQLGRLEAAKAEAEREVQTKKSHLNTLTEKAEQGAAEFADRVAGVELLIFQAERVAQCAAEARSQAQSLLQEANELRATYNQQRLKIERDISQTLMSDLTEFARSNRNIVTIEIAELVIDLKSKLKTEDADGISKSRVRLEGRLNDIEQFRTFIELVKLARVEAERLERERLVGRTQRLLDFIKEYVSSNVTSDLVEPLLSINAEVTTVFDQPDPSVNILKKVVIGGETKLAHLDLGEEYAKFLAKRIKLVTTAKNRYLIEGPANEILVFANETGRAPVVRGLKGNLIFEDGRANLCFAHAPNSDPFELLQIKLQVLANNAQSVVIEKGPCNLRLLNQYDIVVVDRDDLLSGQKEIAQALLHAIEDDELSPIAVVSHTQVEATRDAERIIAQTLATGIDDSTINGFGIIYIENDASGICKAINDEQKAHSALILNSQDRLEVEVGTAPHIFEERFSEEGAFISAKRGKCRAIYGAAESLKLLTQSLSRDKIGYRVLPIWFSQEQVDSAAKTIQEEIAKKAMHAKELADKAAEDRRIAELRLRESGEARRLREQELRREYGALARAMEGVLGSEIKLFVENQGAVVRKYPAVAEWYKRMLADEWEPIEARSELDDYGMSGWKGRVLETGFIKTSIRMKNRTRGVYHESCFYFGFDVARYPIGVTCDEREKIDRYKDAGEFTSKWIAN
jgi:tetratricopeptide (TPR) repeat protein